MIDFIPKDMNIPVMRRELTHSNTAWLLRNILVNNKEHPKIDEVVAQLKTLRSKQMNDEINKLEMRFG